MLETPLVKSKSPTLKAQKTKDHIYQVALKLFSEEGFEHSTMREIAKHAGVALGAAYYYFQSKEDIVMYFYQQNQDQLTANARQICIQNPKLEGRIKGVLKMQFEHFAPYRGLFKVLARIGGDANHPLSPFSEDTVGIREKSIHVFKEATEGAKIKIAPDLRSHLPYLLWLYQMGLIYFWINDSSKNQWRTQKLLEASWSILAKLIKHSHLPVLSSVKKVVLKLLKDLKTDKEVA